MPTDPASLLSQANCFACYGNSPYTLKLMQLSLWAQLSAGGVSPPTPPPPPPPVWYDTFPAANINGQNFQFNSESQSSNVTVTQPGTPIAIRIGLGSIGVNGVQLRVALYQFNGATLVLSGSTTINIADSNTVKIIPVSLGGQIGAGVFQLAFSVNSATGQGFSTHAPGNGTNWIGSPFSSFPPASLSGAQASGEDWYMGIEIQP